MDLMQILMQQLSGDGVKQISDQIGMPEDSTNQAVSAAIPVLISALARNSAQPGGAERLQRALQRDHDGSILDNLSGYLSGSGGGADGAAILRHIFGNRQSGVENGLAKQTGLDAATIGKLLITLAPIIMGMLGKTQARNNFDPGSLSGYLEGQKEQARSSSPGVFGMLTDLLDGNDDGSVLDDLGGMAKKYLRNE